MTGMVPASKFRWITREDFHIDNLAEVPVEDDPPDIAGALKYLADTYAEFGMQRQAATMLREREWWLNRLSADDLDQVRRYIALNKQAILDYWYERIDGVELSRLLKRLP